MSKRGVCENCARIMTIRARGLCGMCDDAWLAAPEDGKDAALDAAKAKVDSGVSLRSVASKKRRNAAKKAKNNTPDPGKPAEAKPKHVKYKAVGDIESGDLVCAVKTGVYLEFADERDKKILEWVDSQAKESRRNPDQQIMWILQHYIEVAGAETLSKPLTLNSKP